MSINIDPFTVTAGISQIIPLQEGPAQLRGVKFTNRTVFDITYNGPGHNGEMWVPSNTEFLFTDMQSSNTGIIKLTSYNTTNVSPAPTGIVLVTLYSVDENLPSGTWPISIPQSQVQSNVNNSTLINTGNPSGTQVILVTPTGSSGPTMSYLNDGTLVVATVVAGAPVDVIQVLPGSNPILKLGSSTTAVEIEHILSILNNLVVSGSLSSDSNKITTDGSGNFNKLVSILFSGAGVNVLGYVSSGDLLSVTGVSGANFDSHWKAGGTTGTMWFEPGGGQLAKADSSGIHLVTTASFDLGANGTLKTRNGNTIQAISSFTGAATGTYNHGFGSAPFWVIPMQDVAGSQTMGYDSVTSTQVHITSFSSASFKALCLA